MPYVRTVSAASARRRFRSSYRGSRDIGHISSAHDDADLEVLRAPTRQRLLPVRMNLTWAWIPLRLVVRCFD